jgi:TfoX/Sxy family transcriptional regulator of competence genes
MFERSEAMAYDERLAGRIRHILSSVGSVSERKMFGGIAFMVGGNMACGVIGDELMVRVGPDGHDDALAEPHVRIMDFTHRPSRGMVYVGVPAIASDTDLERWVARGTSFAQTLPPK